jgi:hypothetical protein
MKSSYGGGCLSFYLALSLYHFKGLKDHKQKRVKYAYTEKWGGCLFWGGLIYIYSIVLFRTL